MYFHWQGELRVVWGFKMLSFSGILTDRYPKTQGLTLSHSVLSLSCMKHGESVEFNLHSNFPTGTVKSDVSKVGSVAIRHKSFC